MKSLKKEIEEDLTFDIAFDINSLEDLLSCHYSLEPLWWTTEKSLMDKLYDIDKEKDTDLIGYLIEDQTNIIINQGYEEFTTNRCVNCEDKYKSKCKGEKITIYLNIEDKDTLYLKEVKVEFPKCINSNWK